MVKEIGWYLIEVERQLSGRLTKEQLGGLLAETEAHLQDLVFGLEELGDPEPGRRAVERFGPVPAYVSDVLASPPYNRGSWVAGFIPGFAALWLCLIPAFMIGSWFVQGDLLTMLAALVLPALAVTFIWAARARRTWHRAIIAGCIAGFASLLTVAVFGAVDLGEPDGKMLIPRLGSAVQKQDWLNEQAQYGLVLDQLVAAQTYYDGRGSQRFAHFYRHGAGGFEMLRRGDLALIGKLEKPFRHPDEGPPFSERFTVPVFLDVQGNQVSLGTRTYDTFDAAREHWLIEGKKALDAAMSRQAFLSDALDSYPEALERPMLMQIAAFAPQCLWWSAIAMLLLWAAGSAGAWFGDARQLNRKRFAWN